jgi:hypothetical protein
LTEKPSQRGWVQTDRASHEAWALLTRRSPLAAQLMHLLAARVGDHNAVVISQKTLAQIAQASRRGVQNALKVLADERWLEVIQIGATGSVNGYVLMTEWSGMVHVMDCATRSSAPWSLSQMRTSRTARFSGDRARCSKCLGCFRKSSSCLPGQGFLHLQSPLCQGSSQRCRRSKSGEVNLRRSVHYSRG